MGIYLFITYLFTSLLLSYVSYNLTLFIDFTMNDGNIMDWYYSILKQKVNPRCPKLSKVLGMCPICFGFWTSTFFYIWIYTIFPMPIIFYVIYIGMVEGLLISKYLK